MGKFGALPSQMIHGILDAGFITGSQKENVRPGSLDLSITDEVYRVRGVFLPSHDETVYDAISRVGGIQLRGEKILLEQGCCYCIKLAESIKRLPADVYSYCNPKSSSGRVDLHVRLLVDHSSRYDAIDKNYSGPLWVLLVPKTFSVLVSPGLTLNQIRFFTRDTRFDELALDTHFGLRGGLLYDESASRFAYKDVRHTDGDGSILLSLGLNYPVPGFEAIEIGEPIDLLLKNHYDPKYFFREISVNNESIVLNSGSFYILSSKEYVRVPPNLACEMRPMDERSGDLRSHYAGFIDPGWGVGSDGVGVGRPLTLEVRSWDRRLIIRDGQPIAKIRFEFMTDDPTEHYDQMSPTYGSQAGPKLGKQFQDWEQSEEVGI